MLETGSSTVDSVKSSELLEIQSSMVNSSTVEFVARVLRRCDPCSLALAALYSHLAPSQLLRAQNDKDGLDKFPEGCKLFIDSQLLDYDTKMPLKNASTPMRPSASMGLMQLTY